jgi:transcriptional/translational regulatory protein YebC/TACO1
MQAEVFEELMMSDVDHTPIELTEEQMVEVETIVDKLEDDDDVQAVFTNLA